MSNDIGCKRCREVHGCSHTYAEYTGKSLASHLSSSTFPATLHNSEAARREPASEIKQTKQRKAKRTRMSDGKPSITTCILWLNELEDLSLEHSSRNLDNDLDVICACVGYLKELAVIVRSAQR